jgi:hypothetical protein
MRFCLRREDVGPLHPFLVLDRRNCIPDMGKML